MVILGHSEFASAPSQQPADPLAAAGAERRRPGRGAALPHSGRRAPRAPAAPGLARRAPAGPTCAGWRPCSWRQRLLLDRRYRQAGAAARAGRRPSAEFVARLQPTIPLRILLYGAASAPVVPGGADAGRGRRRRRAGHGSRVRHLRRSAARVLYGIGLAFGPYAPLLGAPTGPHLVTSGCCQSPLFFAIGVFFGLERERRSRVERRRSALIAAGIAIHAIEVYCWMTDARRLAVPAGDADRHRDLRRGRRRCWRSSPGATPTRSRGSAGFVAVRARRLPDVTSSSSRRCCRRAARFRSSRCGLLLPAVVAVLSFGRQRSWLGMRRAGAAAGGERGQEGRRRAP